MTENTTQNQRQFNDELKTYWRLLSYLKPFWRTAIVVLLGFIISAATEVYIAQLLKFIIDAINHADQSAKNWFPILVIILFFFRGLGAFLGNYYSAKISRNLVYNLRQEVFEKFLHLPSRYYLENSSGHMTARILFNVEQVTAASTESIKTLVKDGLTVLGLIGYLLYINWKLSLTIVIISPIIGLLIRQAARRMRRLSDHLQHSMADVNHAVQESISGYTAVKAYGGQDYERARFKFHSLDNLRTGLKLIAVVSLNAPLIQLIMAMAMSVVIWLALRPQILGDTSAGEFIAYITAAGLLARPVKALTEINEKVQRGLAGANSVFEVLDEPDEVNQGTEKPHIQGHIQFQNVSLTYPDGKKALNDIHLQIPAGKIVALVGYSGAGKTTLVNALLRYQDYDHGTILLDETKLEDIELKYLRQNIAVVNQQVVLFNRSIKENIAYGELAGANDEQIIAAAKAAYAHDFIMQLPQGYDTVLGSQGLNLSGGQRQRIAIARAMLKNAPILILDEATSALDNQSEYFIQQALEQAMQGRTTIVIAHRLSTIEKADQIVVMSNGQIVEQGTHDELLSAEGEYAKLHRRQFHE